LASAVESALREARPVLQEVSAVSEERPAGAVSPEDSAAPAARPAWPGEEQVARVQSAAEPVLPEELVRAVRRAAGLAAAGEPRAAQELLQDAGARGGDQIFRPALVAALEKPSRPIGVPPRRGAVSTSRALE